MNQTDPKNKVKEALMSKLKGLSSINLKSDYQVPPPNFSTHMQMPPQHSQQPPMRVDTEEDFRKMPYEGKAKYDNQLKALNALKNETEQRSQRPKKMFFEHYDTQEPYCPIIQNNSNPSGRPPNIPPSMYEGITVKPKRPWVYLGTQNLPPVQYQEINESSFKNIAKKNMETAKQESKKIQPSNMVNQNAKPRKKATKQEVQRNDMNSQLDMSDQIVDEGESIFASQYNTQTINRQSQNKKSRISSMRQSERSYFGQDYSVSQGIETKNKQAEIFGSDQDEGDGSQQDQSQMFSRSKQKNMAHAKNKKNLKVRKEEQYSD